MAQPESMSMPNRVIPLTVVLLIVGPAIAGAEIYKYVDEDGSTVYSDEPVPGAETVDPGSLNTYTPDPATTRLTREESSGNPDDGPSYESVAITEPENDSAFWNAAGTVPVNVRVEPGLAGGHRLELLLYGEPVSEPGTATRFSLQEVFRGTHTLTARVVDGEGNTVIASAPTTFTLHKPSLLNPPNPR